MSAPSASPPLTSLRELRRIMPLFQRYRGRYIFGVIALVGAVVLRIAVPYILGQTVDVLRQAAADPNGAGVNATELTRLALLGGLSIAAVAFGGAILRTGSRLLVLGNSRRAVRDLRNQIMAHLLKLSPSYYGRNATGNLMSRCVNDVQFVQSLLGPVFMYLAETGTLYVVSLVFMMKISVSLTLLSIIPFPFFLWRARRMATRIQKDSRAAQEALAEVSSKVEESLSGSMVIRSLALEDFDMARFEKRCSSYRDLNIKVSRERAMLGFGMNLLASISTLVVLIFGGPMAANGSISLGDFVAMVFYLHMLAAPTGVLGFVISSLQRGTAALARVGQMLDVKPTLVSAEEPQATSMQAPSIKVTDLTVVLKNEKGEPRKVLDEVGFTVPGGTLLGVVGPTGSGKSVLLGALARQLEVERGKIAYDDIDVHDRGVADIRRDVGYVPQEAFLFSASLADNIALGRPEASRAEVEQAVAASHLAQDLDQLPQGYDTVVGERGLNLSGGQRQRTALARAMLIEPQVLLLDDPFSAVDASTTDDILSDLQPFMKQRTTVLVAHRVATVQAADHILVLDEGRVIESGTHEQLLVANGLYASLHQRQQQREHLREELGDVDLDDFNQEEEG
ncbi:MAG: ABC transporter ATP-binding protein [Planctomycetes bacterium]|nr:ABC transporter ATP-binding protein [Planctomycetota bacterium]MCP4771505.1 ABC transporter ATP-binding protein [Planctomycetota bacterium]MCP4861166.1 ABC transporter ATP-binding protein [Planctomycetota bacterium]